MNKKIVKISTLLSLMLIFSFMACKPEAEVETPAETESTTAVQYTVTFNANDGSANPATATQAFTAGTAQALKTAATLGFSKTNYAFAGWATSSDATSAAYADGASYTAEADVTLYAVWTAITLSSISVSGSPKFSVDNIFFAESVASTYGLTVTATYSDSTTVDVSSSATITATVSNSAGNVTVTYTKDEITKTAEVIGSYYVAARDALTQEVLDNGTTIIDSKTFKLVKFGDFPQTIADDEITYSDSTVYNDWYLGSDGYFYEKVQENGNSTSYKYSNDVSVAEINNTSPNYLYFKVEPIEWRVLKTDTSAKTKLLLAEKILTANVPYYKYDSSSNTRTIDEATIYPNNYKYSQIRAYLNGLNYYNDSNTAVTTYNENGFLQKAFTTSARNLIPETEVDNSEDSTTDTGNNITKATSYACDNTSDKIFLLSEEEVTTSAYGFAEYNSYGAGNARIRVTTDYAKANYAYQSTTSGYGGYWWLRSPRYDYSNYARYVLGSGNARSSDGVDSSDRGVCPALSISFE